MNTNLLLKQKTSLLFSVQVESKKHFNYKNFDICWPQHLINLWSTVSWLEPIPSQNWLKICFRLKITQSFGHSRWSEEGLNITMLLSYPQFLQCCKTPAGGTLSWSCTNKTTALPLFSIQLGAKLLRIIVECLSFMFLWDCHVLTAVLTTVTTD